MPRFTPTNLVVLKGLGFQRFKAQFRMRRAGQLTALEIDGQVLRVVQAVARGSRVDLPLVATVPLDLPANADRSDPAVLGRAIPKALEKLRIQPTLVVMGVPRSVVVLRTLAAPVIQDARELASIVHFQLSRDLPFRADEAVIDFRVRPPSLPAQPPSSDAAPATPKLEVLAAAVKREIVDFHRAVADAAGLKLAGLGLLAYANARCLDACEVARDGGAVALVSLRPAEVNIDVIAQQALLFSRGAAVKEQAAEEPAPDFSPLPAPVADEAPAPTEPAPVPEKLSYADAVTIEVVRSLHSYGGMEPNNPVTKIVVVGASGQEAAVVDTLGKRLSTPCQLLEIGRALDLPAAAREHAPAAMSAIGLALGANDPQGLPFDFLHPKQPAVERDLGRIRTIMGAAAAVAALLLLLGVRRHLAGQRHQVLLAEQQKLVAAQKHQALYRQTRVQAATLQEWVREGRNWLEHYAYLSAILPASHEIYITSFSVSGQGTISLSVQARSGEVLAKLDKQLRAAGYEVKPQAINPGADRHGYDFRSSFELIVPAKMKIDLSKVKPPARPSDDVSLEGAGKPTARVATGRKAATLAHASGGPR